mmetsp:Transcript_3050/g.7026  ORF Transcript_3050/g.7026 Transcript_3050/m.7026 type:complete len:340 (-) Transcript_3050:422-1441(-)
MMYQASVLLQGGGSSGLAHSHGGRHLACHKHNPAWSRAGRRTVQHIRPVPPARITNTSNEIWQYKGMPPQNEDNEEILVDQLEVLNPELGRLEHRIGKVYLDELFQDSGVDLEETAYWFHTPPGGWSTSPVRLKPAEQAPITFPEPNHLEPELQNRVPFENLEEGSVITGPITDVWLYHGIQVDFGASSDGLVPITQDQWMEAGLRDILKPGMEVTARIYKLRQPGLYRWPVQLQLIEPAQVAMVLSPPEEYFATIDHGWCAAQGWSVNDICARTERRYKPAQFLLGEHDADIMQEMEDAFGYDHPDNDPDEDDEREEAERELFAGNIMELMTHHTLLR